MVISHDWFLPSQQELESVLEVISDNEEYQETSYWSSTEHQYNQTHAFVGHINFTRRSKYCWY